MAAEIAGTTDQALRISANMIITCFSESSVTLESGCEKSVKNGKSSYKFLQTTVLFRNNSYSRALHCSPAMRGYT
jgi:hypothetical protein